MYSILKTLHVATVVLSFAGFQLRALWMMTDSPLLRARPTRILPHVIDTILLASALLLAWIIHQWPFVQPWLTAKVLGLLAYIVIGSLALKRGRTKAARIGAWIAATLVFLYIVGVALTHSAALGLA